MVAQQEILPYAYFENKIVPFSQANISIASQSVQYGLTCFGGIRGYHREGKNKVFRLHDHYLRLKEGIHCLGIEAPCLWEEFQGIVRELIECNAPKADFYIRPFFHAGSLALGPRFLGMPFHFSVYMMTLGSYFEHAKGLRLKTSSWRKFSDAALPTKSKAGGCYLNTALAKSEAMLDGYDDALMMDEQGSIVEATVANIFLSRRGKLLMPETGSSMLEGITRRTVIEILQEASIPIQAAKIDRSMVYAAEELFLTGTAVQLAFVHSVDGRVIAADQKPGPFCTLLTQKFDEILRGSHPFSSQWLTEYP